MIEGLDEEVEAQVRREAGGDDQYKELHLLGSGLVNKINLGGGV